MIELCRSQKVIDIIDAGFAEYREVYNLQKELVRKRKAGLIGDTLILAEHPPVFTIGRRGSAANLLVSEGCLKENSLELIRVDRGGDITFHGPGQLVLYPILDLLGWGGDIRLYIRRLEDVMIDFLSRYNISGIRISGDTGVWIDKDTKIGFIGIGVSRWVTYHGLSINVNTPLRYFDMIRPCGLRRCAVASVSSILKKDIDAADAKAHLIDSFKGTFTYDATHYQ